MSHYTVLVIPEGTQSPRRFRVAQKALRRSVWALGFGAVLLLAVCVDYVRVRFDVVELDSLRAETTAQRTQLDALSTTLSGVEGRLTQLGEFEQKVRMIADLPPAVAGRSDGMVAVGGGSERLVQEPGSAESGSAEPAVDEPSSSPASQGGEADAVPTPKAPPAADESGTASESPAPVEATPATIESRAAALRAKGEDLSARADEQQASFADLLSRLDGKRRLLASTPSIWPAEGWLTSRYGHRVSPFTGRRQLHAGIDIAGATGTPIIAPARGRVVFSGYKGHMGRTVVLDHGFRMRTTFGHAKELNVRPGQEVERGQRIASIGSTGRSTGPHLHYALEINGRTVNPLNYILE
jgi:murein DD-endopeptidase MepM/ murein hydrolase activator NlpD